MRTVSCVLLLVCLLGAAAAQDYKDQEGWGGECQTGQKQSPIAIITKNVEGCEPDFFFELSSKDEDYTQIAHDPTNENLKTPFTLSTIRIAKRAPPKVYNAIQFHLHHRSEHQINHVSYDLELHVVHQNAQDKSLAVFGVLFRSEEGDFEDPFDHWNLDTKEPVQQRFPIDLTTPEKVFHYQGSLTTPDCSEGVQWFVNEEVVRIKDSTLDKISELINEGHFNNREVQALNGRTVTEAGSVCRHLRRNKGKGNGRHMLRAAAQ